MPGTILDLPIDILKNEIFKYLNLNDINVNYVCKKFNKIFNTKILIS